MPRRKANATAGKRKKSNPKPAEAKPKPAMISRNRRTSRRGRR